MNDPIKIIFKYKNNNKKYQYHTYIYIGNIPRDIKKILVNFKNKNLVDTLTDNNKNDINKLTSFYGESWYRYFFNSYHINSTFSIIEKTPSVKDNIIRKYGKKWYDKHIKSFVIMDKKIFYNYESIVKEEIIDREYSKSEQQLEIFDTDDYRTLRRAPVIKNQLGGDQLGGDQLGGDQLGGDQLGGDQLGGDLLPGDIDKDGVVSFEEGLESDILLQDEEIDLDNIEKIFEDVEKDDNIKKTSDLIQKALDDNKILKKVDKDMLDFDQSKDDNMQDELLKDVYEKKYITSQYIYKDDTIKVIKNKICCSIKNNAKFDDVAYIAPSRQYLYSEYMFENKLDTVMLGQKWIKKTELLKIDILPNRKIRYYEGLHGNLRMLKDNIKRYGSKIKWEDNDNYVLFDYDGYYMNNEIYMLDIYHELGLGYSASEEEVNNLTDVYIRVYFRRINSDNVKYIINYLNNNKNVEKSRITTIYNTIKNDLLLENEIMNTVENVKREEDYKKIFTKRFIIQSVVHTNLQNTYSKKSAKLDMFRIFNEFDVTEEYPFIQYHSPNGEIIFKYNKEEILKFGQNKKNTDVMFKWFESAPYGLSFKIKLKDTEDITQIKLSELGRLEYKTSWKEERMANINDVMNTYIYARKLIKRINSDDNKTVFNIPEDHEFKFAFINSIQKFELPEDYTINHNDLSDFSRYFFPYIALQISPRKRAAKNVTYSKYSKYGTYLRYKRISKYYNKGRIECRILYFIRNYDYTEKSLADEISKQFNITLEKALEEISYVKGKYPNIKKSRNILKKIENIPKYKPPGIGIDIQGKKRENYKIRISGARNHDQMDRIVDFLNVLLYLYSEVYLLKNKKYQKLQDKLKKLTDIAKRRNKVNTTIQYDKDITNIKQMTTADSDRLGFKPEKGQNQWSRACQNTGDKIRQPQMVSTVDQLVEQKFKLNSKNGLYEKQVKIKDKSGKISTITVRAVGLEATNKKDNKNSIIYYTCSPKINGEYMHIGFLTRSKNPHGLCMPCCYKKDFYTSSNANKKNFFMKCIGKEEINKKDKVDTNKVFGDQLYILQDTNKIQEGRLGRLPKYLNYYFNTVRDKKHIIKQHYLITTTPNYFFKYGSNQDNYNFLGAIGVLYGLTAKGVINTLINKLENDKSNLLFTSINNGDIRNRFKDRQKFIDYIKFSNILNFELFNHFVSIPGVISKNGINIIMFNRQSIVVRMALEKEHVRDDFTIICQNNEELDNVYNPDYDTVFLLKEGNHIYPIVSVEKKDKYSKQINIQYIFKYEENPNNIVKYVSDYYIQNCKQDLLKHVKDNNITAKQLYKILNNNKKYGDKYNPKYQIIDIRNKCRYIMTNNSTILPVTPSGSIYNLQIIKNFEVKLLSLKDTIKNLNEVNTILNNIYDLSIVGVYYISRNNNNITAIAVYNKNFDIIPIKEESIGISWLNNNKLLFREATLYDKIDKYLESGNNNIILDNRIVNVNRSKYMNESYELFRLEFSEYINNDNVNIKNKIIKIIRDKKSDKKERKFKLKRILYRLTDSSLIKLFEKYQKGGKYDKLVHIINNIPDTNRYAVNNTRDICNNMNKDTCDSNLHCKWSHNNCYFAATKSMIIKFVNKISGELIEDSYKAAEILKEDYHYVSDIVDYNKFTYKKGQHIVKSTNTNINKLLKELFGRNNLPIVGKRKIIKQKSQSTDVDDYYIENMGDYYLQTIIHNNMTILRAFVNAYTWSKHQYYDIQVRNLGYHSDMQTDMANYFRSIIIDWLNNPKNNNTIKNTLANYIDTNIPLFIDELFRTSLITSGIIEYYILSNTYNIPVIIYSDIDIIKFIFVDNIIYDNQKKNIPINIIEKYNNKQNMKNTVNILYIYEDSDDIPDKVRVIYV